MIDLFGYVGLAFTLFALSRENMVLLRIFSLVGLVFFLTQSVMLESHSLIFTNVSFIALHVSMLYKEWRKENA